LHAHPTPRIDHRTVSCVNSCLRPARSYVNATYAACLAWCSPGYLCRVKQLFHLVHQVAQMEGLRQDLGILRRVGIRIESYGGKAGDEHDLEIRIDLRGA